MPSLLDLPQELRDMILELVLYSDRPIITCPCAVGDNRLEHELHSGGRCNAKYHPSASTPIYLTLMLVNRQLAAETKYIVELRGLVYAVDVLVVSGNNLMCTWQAVPADSNQIDELAVTVRCVGIWDMAGFNPRFHAGIFGNRFFRVLRGLCEKGPRFPSSKNQDRDMSVKEVAVNIITPPKPCKLPPSELSYQDWANTPNSDRVHYAMPPRWLADNILAPALMNQLQTGVRGGALFARVEKVRLLIDGHFHREFDWAQVLAGAERVERRQFRLPAQPDASRRANRRILREHMNRRNRRQNARLSVAKPVAAPVTTD